MNNIISNFEQTLAFADQYGMPLTKKRGIIREYIQSLFISRLYALKGSEKLSFVGGTSLRLLKNLPRFSEDLDFDALGITDVEVIALISQVATSFTRENIVIEMDQNRTENKTYFTLKFPNLLFDLKISSNHREKLMIKVDYSSLWKKQTPTIVLFSRYGVIEQVVTNSLNQLLVQKLTAYVQRRETQPRDIYDVIWLYAQGASVDKQFAHENRVVDIVARAIEKYAQEGVNLTMRRKLQPFLFDEAEINKLDLFEQVMAKLAG